MPWASDVAHLAKVLAIWSELRVYSVGGGLISMLRTLGLESQPCTDWAQWYILIPVLGRDRQESRGSGSSLAT